MPTLFECYLNTYDDIFTEKQITGLFKRYKKIMTAISKINDSKIKLLPFQYIIRKLLEFSNCKDEYILAIFPYPRNEYNKDFDVMILDEYEKLWNMAAIDIGWIFPLDR